MWIELLAAALVGLSLLWLVFEPLLTAHGARPADVIDLDALEDLEDTRSGVALAALKEIEFDRETGKLSDGDYDFLKQKYTVEALSALRAEDQGAPEADIEAQVAAGQWTDVVWGNHDAIDQRLAPLGETRALTEWFARWQESAGL